MPDSELKNQLHVYHNPFAAKTEQPKIPDGKTTHSLGFSTQAVDEFQTKLSADGQMDILLYPGLNSCVTVVNSEKPILGSRNYYNVGFNRSSDVNWSELIGGSAGDVTFGEKYAKWRVVSAGMQVKLLNTVDEDDGWWEAIRFHPQVNNSDWKLSTTDDQTEAGLTTNGSGVCAPTALLESTLRSQTIVNEPSYMTGLLRDLHKVQFQTHPTKSEHDFKNVTDPCRVDASDFTHNTNEDEIAFDRGSANSYAVINNCIDWSHDFVYLRIHGRENKSDQTGSRLHLNTVLNQEIVFNAEDRLSRFHTRTMNIGDGNMDAHVNLKRAAHGAANYISATG